MSLFMYKRAQTPIFLTNLLCLLLPFIRWIWIRQCTGRLYEYFCPTYAFTPLELVCEYRVLCVARSVFRVVCHALCVAGAVFVVRSAL